jgi:hypothetical protein
VSFMAAELAAAMAVRGGPIRPGRDRGVGRTRSGSCRWRPGARGRSTGPAWQAARSGAGAPGGSGGGDDRRLRRHRTGRGSAG